MFDAHREPVRPVRRADGAHGNLRDVPELRRVVGGMRVTTGNKGDKMEPPISWATVTTVAAEPLNVEQMLSAVRYFQNEQKHIDNHFVEALLDLIGQTKMRPWELAIQLGVGVFELQGVLDGTTRPIPDRFYEAVRRVFPRA